jgi:hypothetical protein
MEASIIECKNLNEYTSSELSEYEKLSVKEIKEWKKFQRAIIKEQKRRFDNCISK